jgi:hypothetical protein
LARSESCACSWNWEAISTEMVEKGMNLRKTGYCQEWMFDIKLSSNDDNNSHYTYFSPCKTILNLCWISVLEGHQRVYFEVG